MADSAFLAAAVDFATIITDDADSNDTDVNNETFIGDLFSNDSFDDFDFNETTKNTTATTFGFLDNLVRLLNNLIFKIKVSFQSSHMIIKNETNVYCYYGKILLT